MDSREITKFERILVKLNYNSNKPEKDSTFTIFRRNNLLFLEGVYYKKYIVLSTYYLGTYAL